LYDAPFGPSMRCDSCSLPAVIDQPYAGAHRCGPHFARTVRERFRRAMHDQFPKFRGGIVAVALSGGKDSAVALALTHAYVTRRPGAKVVAVSVDEGIAGYRGATLAAGAALCQQLGIEQRIVRFEAEVGTTTDATALKVLGSPPCGYCGVWRRQLLNRAARELGAEALVLGFNLDDLAQTVLMNLARGEVDRLRRMAPHRQRQPELVPRIAPLAMVPEREVYLFAQLEGLPFDHGTCPHAGRAARNVFREVVWQLEEALPGTRQSLLRTREKLLDLLEAASPGAQAARCGRCGEPSAGPVCRACQFLDPLEHPLMAGARS
jgi:uncharacterized protein (TIGR00269 family)